MTLSAGDFPAGTPLHHFFAWNEAKSWPDRRAWRMREPDRLPRDQAEALTAAIGNPDPAAHAAVFAAFEAPHPGPRHIVVIRLSAFGDFIQALGPFAAIRRHHATDRLSLLTTRPLADFAAGLGLFDEIIVDERPGPLSVAGWLALRGRLHAGKFDRVYDLQTSTRSGLYAWLLRPALSEWSGIAWHCSHPHANLGRDAQHTLDKQAEQLLMAGIYPTPPPTLPDFDRGLPTELLGRDFALLVPGSSPQHLEKRWPVARFAALARALADLRLAPVVVGTADEAPLGALIRTACPDAVDLVGQTDLPLLAALARQARLTVGNDTGVCHLAAAAGCSVLVLFSRATEPARHAPRGANVRILAEPELNDLTAERVIAAAMELLENRKALGPRAGGDPCSQRSERLKNGSRPSPGTSL